VASAGLDEELDVGRPRFRQVALTLEHRMTSRAGVGQVNRDLSVSIRPAVPPYWR
jgi:hypothetical protein